MLASPLSVTTSWPAFCKNAPMNSKILILDGHAEIYRDRLQAEFPQLQFALAHGLSELPEDLSGIDVLISFAIELKDEFYQRAAHLKWIQCLATGVDHVFRCPSLKPDVLLTSGRGIHGAPMRETVVYLMMGVSRSVAALVEDQKAHVWDRRFWGLFYGKTAVIAGVGVVGIAIGRLLDAFGMHIIGVTRTPRAVGPRRDASSDAVITRRVARWWLSVMLTRPPDRVALSMRRSTSWSPINRLMSSAASLALMRVTTLVPVMPNQDLAWSGP